MQPHLRYLAYVLRHKWHVFIACRGLHVPLWQAIIHDWTKFLPCEWFPYVQRFYGAAQVTAARSRQRCCQLPAHDACSTIAAPAHAFVMPIYDS